jgi:hypothetical protein
VSFAVIILCVASERVFIVVVMTQSGNFWIHPRTSECLYYKEIYLKREIIRCLGVPS